MFWQFLANGSMPAAELALTYVIQSTVLLVLGLLAARLLGRSRPAVQSAVYRTALVAILLCPCASLLLTAMGCGGLILSLPSQLANETAIEGSLAHKSTQELAFREAAGHPREQLRDEISEPGAGAGALRSVDTLGIETTRDNDSMSGVPSMATSNSIPAWLARGILLGLGVWLLGSVVLATRLAIGQSRMARLRWGAIPAGPEAEALCGELAVRMGLTRPAVLRSPFVSSPCLDGLRWPVILLPEDTEANLRETLIHELAHLARRDGLWNYLRRVTSAVFWIQPLLWILSRRMEVTAEEVCDDYVVQFGTDRARYAGHLLMLAERTLPPLAPSGVGMISLRSLLAWRVTRILDSSRKLSTAAGTRAVTATLLVGLMGTLLTGLIGVGDGNRRALGNEPKVENPRNTRKAVSSTPPKNTGKGRVKEPEQPPVIEGDQGKAHARDDVPISGRIIDLEGRPVAGATVQLVSYNTSRTGDLTPWLDAVRSDQPAVIARQRLNPYETPASARKVTTDQEGRFRFESFGPERIAHLLLEGPTIASAFFTVVTRPIESFRTRESPDSSPERFETVYGADFTYSAAPGRPIEGIVRDARTKQPLAGVIVRSSRSLNTVHAAQQMLATATNEQGRFRLVGLSKARTSPRVTRDLLTIIPNDDQPYFMSNIPVLNPPGLEPVLMEIELHRGLWITGKVTDKKTGHPIQGVPLHYLPFLENKFAQATPEFGPNRSVLVIVRDRYKTKPDGTYRLVGLPGRAIVGVAPWDRVPYRYGFGADSIEGKDERGHFATWWNPFPAGETSLLAMKEINPPEGAAAVHLDLELDPGASVRVTVVDREGKPLPGSGVIRRMSTSNLETMPEADFDVVALGPGEERSVLIRHDGRKLGKAVHIHPGDDKAGPLQVTLEPLATIVGRVLDADGNPVAGATIRVPRLSAMATGKDGRFQVADVPAGVDYSLTITSRSNVTGRRTVTTQTTVRPGETTDIGDVRLKGQ